MKKIFCVISHTHWDREWYVPFEQFRIRLVDLMDGILDIFGKCPNYLFHLDAQTIVLDDYLEIRPHRKAIIEKHIKEGRLLVGPWYVQNDFYLTSGEATVRNLLAGMKIAKMFGRCERVGYAPDQFGLISQLPQIFNGFGIGSCIFGRGYSFYENTGSDLKPVPMPAEFLWNSEDGSRVLAVHLPNWYNNAQRFPEDIRKSLKLLSEVERSFEGIALTPYLLLMNGVDHLEAQENLLPILEKVNQRLPEGSIIRQFTMQEYVDSVNEYINNQAHPITFYEGELRNGEDHAILQGTLSSRIYLKSANVIAQNLLECNMEPVYSFIHLMGITGKYPSDHMDYLWKLLIKNHSHDCICGCSADGVHEDMENRYKRVKEAGQELLKRGLYFISAHITREGMTNKDCIITFFNTVETNRGSVAELDIYFPVEEKVKGFRLFDPQGNNVPFTVKYVTRSIKGVFSPINLPGYKEIDLFRVQVYLDNIAGMGYTTLLVRPDDREAASVQVPVSEEADRILENEYLRAVIYKDGKVDLLYKKTGALYRDILKLEDVGDCGDAYVFRKMDGDIPFLSDGLVPEISCLAANPMEICYRLSYTLMLPEYYDEAAGKRSEKLVENRVEIRLSLSKGSKWLEVGFKVQNRSMDHRLRALISSGIPGDTSAAGAPFDIISRDRRKILSRVNKDGTQPNSGFVDIHGEKEGLAVLNEGIHAYEHLMESEGTLAFTLVRSTPFITRIGNCEAVDNVWYIPGNQCIRDIGLRMALFPHEGDHIAAEAALKTKEFLNPVLCCFQPADVKKFMGGRPAVQDSEISEIFYREDPFAALILPLAGSFIDIRGKGIVLSAIKKADSSDMLIVRIYNSSTEESVLELNFINPIHYAYKVNLAEEILQELSFKGSALIPMKLKPKEILSIAVK